MTVGDEEQQVRCLTEDDLRKYEAYRKILEYSLSH